jgi:hypothetical protein
LLPPAAALLLVALLVPLPVAAALVAALLLVALLLPVLLLPHPARRANITTARSTPVSPAHLRLPRSTLSFTLIPLRLHCMRLGGDAAVKLYPE